jgi:hypothetical protein
VTEEGFRLVNRGDGDGVAEDGPLGGGRRSLPVWELVRRHYVRINHACASSDMYIPGEGWGGGALLGAIDDFIATIDNSEREVGRRCRYGSGARRQARFKGQQEELSISQSEESISKDTYPPHLPISKPMLVSESNTQSQIII